MARPLRHLVVLITSVSLAALSGAGGCKKKPKGSADGGAGASGSTAPPSGDAPVQTGEGVINWSVAQLRSTPAKDAIIVANLTKGARVVLLERRDGWSRVRPVEGKSEGWLLNEAVLGGVVVGASAVAGAPAQAPALRKVRVDKPSVNLRDTANGRKVLAKLEKGSTFTILRDEGDWLEIQGGGRTGWVAKKVVTVLGPAQATTAAGVGVAAGGASGGSAAPAAAPAEKSLGEAKVKWNNINLREKADGNRLGQLPKGAHLTILTQEKDWLQVRTDDGKRGWLTERGVERLSVAKAAPEPTPPPAGAAANDDADTPGAPGRVKWTKVNLRSSPPQGAILATLQRGTRLEILATQGKFYRVKYKEHEGFIAVKAVEKVAAGDASGAAAQAPPQPLPVAARPVAPQGAAPVPTARPAAAAQPATRATPAAAQPRPAASNDEEPVDDDDRGGRAKAAPSGAVRQIVFTTVNLRESPKGRAIDKLARGTKVRELESEEKWMKVQTLDKSRTGWVVKRAVGTASN